MQFFVSWRVIIKRIKAIRFMMADKTVPKRKKALIIFGLVYLFLPVDLIPPVLFPFGFLDDLVLWIWILYTLKETLEPTAAVTLTATYVAEAKAGFLSASATADAEEVGDGLGAEPPFESFQWSVDGKNWYPNCAEVPVDTGGKSKTFSVQWRSLSDSWAAPSGKTSVTVSCEDYAHVESAAFTYVPVATAAAMTSMLPHSSTGIWLSRALAP